METISHNRCVGKVLTRNAAVRYKSVLYEESVRIPFILSQKGVIPAGIVDDEHLVSNGLDLLPTLCDAANIKIPDGLRGRSLLPLAYQRTEDGWRNFVVVESQHGRMLRTDRFKYSIYSSGKNREQLVDLKNDPGEMRNLSDNPDYKSVLDEHRGLLKEWCEANNDTMGLRYLVPE